MSIIQTTHKASFALLSVIAAILVYQAFAPVHIPPAPPKPASALPKMNATCVGEPIVVDFSYAGDMLEPWTCKVQCEDKVQRYVLYSDGQATQCSMLPECLDWGEDNSITCTPPATSASSQ